MLEERAKAELISFINDQISQSSLKAKAYLFDENNRKNPTRNLFVKLRSYSTNFLRGNPTVRTVVVTGLRGTGKTTLLWQLFTELSESQAYKLFLPVDQISQYFGASINDALRTYEEMLGLTLESLDKPLFLFLDEVHYDKSWDISLKSIYDRTNKVFVLATGSSAVLLNSSSDTARRAIFEKLYPMSFSEFLKVKASKYEPKGLCPNIRQIIFESGSAQEVYEKLQSLETIVGKYWLGIDRTEIARYLKYGTLPFVVKQTNEPLIYEQLKRIMDRIINSDIRDLGSFNSQTISKIPEVLYLVASSDILSITSLSQRLAVSKPVLYEVMSCLEKTETLVRVYPYGQHEAQVTKPSKYLFLSPAFRATYFNFIGSMVRKENQVGKLLEDLVGLYLVRYLSGKTNTAITYDTDQPGADFITRHQEQILALEVSQGSKDDKQLIKTIERSNARYGICVSSNPLGVSGGGKIVSVPLRFFLLA